MNFLLKNMLKNFILICNLILEKYLREISYRRVKNKNYKKIFVFDLDNTLVNTWAGFNHNNGSPSFLSYFLIFKKAKVFPQMSKLLHSIDTNNNKIIFLSARDSVFYFTTKNWLSNNLSIGNYSLILVNGADRKLNILSNLSQIGNVFYFDDLSYGHETGTIYFYNNLIGQVRELPIKYYDFTFISRFNNRYLTH